MAMAKTAFSWLHKKKDCVELVPEEELEAALGCGSGSGSGVGNSIGLAVTTGVATMEVKQIGLVESVVSGASELVERCKAGWSNAWWAGGRRDEVSVACCDEPAVSDSESKFGGGAGMGDASVCIAAAESVFNKLRTVPASEFTGACTYVGRLEPVHESRRRRLATTFDPLSQVNLIAEYCVDSD